MERNEIKKQLEKKYIDPTKESKESYIGIEIEMPIVNLEGGPVDYAVSQIVMNQFIEHFNFTERKMDENGCCYSATDPANGDNISFDCSYNNLELSLGKAKNLEMLEITFKKYVSFLNEKLSVYHHLLTGMGINPGRKINRRDYIPTERYRMLERYLLKYRDWQVPMYFHDYPEFGSFASASQVQLDVKQEELISVLNVFSKLEPVKAVLFSNSVIEDKPDLLCVRDMLWENSTHGINSHNVGLYDCELETIDDLLEYICTTSIFCTEREGRYIHFQPILISDYLTKDKIVGEYYEKGEYLSVEFHPRMEDIEYLRTYKLEDLTFRGTVEFRSVCTQPFCDVMTVAAFHLGAKCNLKKMDELLKADHVLYHHGYSVTELRRLMNQREWPKFIDELQLKKLCLQVLDIVNEGLIERKLGEEKYLSPLYQRAETLTSPGRYMIKALDNGRSMMELVREFAIL